MLTWFISRQLKIMSLNVGVRALLTGLTLAALAASGEPTARRMPLLMPDDFESLKLAAWRIEEGAPDPHNPLLEPAMPWDAGGIMGHGTVLHDPIDGLWKAWQVSTPEETELDGLKSLHEARRRLTYLESRDGVKWHRPMLSLVSWPGHPKTNILLDFDSGGTAQYASVMIDASNKAEPYEMFIFRSPSRNGTIASQMGAQGSVGSLPGPAEKYGLYRYRSKDGKDWKLREGPLEIKGGTDVCYIYRQPAGGYVAYFKVYPPKEPGDRIIPYDVNAKQLQRRVGRATSPDGTHWSGTTVVLGRDLRDPDFAQFLEICPLPVAGGYVALVNYYDAAQQTMCLQFAASRDGLQWWRPDTRPALANAPIGDFGGGLIWQMRQPIVDGTRLYAYYSGSEGIHSAIVDSRFQPQIEIPGGSLIGFRKGTLPYYGALCRASWEADRLWALVSVVGGPMPVEAVTRPRDIGGHTIQVNVRGKKGGQLKAELLDSAGVGLQGFTLDDCKPVTGDHHRITLEWRGGSQAPASAARIRFVFNRSFLYGFEAVQ